VSVQLLLRKAGYAFHTSAEREVVRSIKESVCYVAFKPSEAEAQARTSSFTPTKFTLPDGNIVQVVNVVNACVLSLLVIGVCVVLAGAAWPRMFPGA
jgi:Actin